MGSIILPWAACTTPGRIKTPTSSLQWSWPPLRTTEGEHLIMRHCRMSPTTGATVTPSGFGQSAPQSARGSSRSVYHSFCHSLVLDIVFSSVYVIFLEIETPSLCFRDSLTSSKFFFPPPLFPSFPQPLPMLRFPRCTWTRAAAPEVTGHKYGDPLMELDNSPISITASQVCDDARVPL